MSHVIALMYHALYEHEEQLAALSAEERPYAVSTQSFEQQLQSLRSHGVELLDPATLDVAGNVRTRAVVVTFDDGHESNRTLALPILQKLGARAVFFVTTDFIGKPGFMTAAQVCELADAGMLVGSHGHTHRFLDSLDEAQLREELETSVRILAAATGKSIETISFPGGRFNATTLRVARELGLRRFFTSEVGRFRLDKGAPDLVPRIPVRRGMTHATFEPLALGVPHVLLRAQLLQRAKRWIRGLMGNDAYHRLYTRIAR